MLGGGGGRGERGGLLALFGVVVLGSRAGDALRSVGIVVGVVLVRHVFVLVRHSSMSQGMLACWPLTTRERHYNDRGFRFSRSAEGR